MRRGANRCCRGVSGALLVAGLVLAACDGDEFRWIIEQTHGHGAGGGQGGVGGQGGGVTPAPTVTATEPVDGTIGVEPTTTIRATFDGALEPTTVDTQTFRIVRDDDGQTVAGAVSYDPATRTASFSPEGPLALLGHYTATVSTGVRGLGGAPLASDRSWRFSVRDGDWGAPQAISDGRGNPAPPRLSVDAAGDAIVVWSQRSPDRDDIWANRLDAAAGWGAPQLIEHEDAGALMFPDVAVAPSGETAAVWYGPQFGSEAFIVGANRFLPESGWQMAEPAGNEAQTSGNPRVTIDPRGVVTVIWTRFSSTHDTVVNQFVPGVGWGTPIVLGSDDDGLFGYAPRVVADRAGNVTAVWPQNANSGPTLWFSRHAPAADWTPAALVPTGFDHDSNDPELAVDAEGNVTVAWNQYGSLYTHVWSNRYVPGRGWETPVQIDRAARGANTPRIAANARGELVALWAQDVNETGSVDYRLGSARFSPSDGWGAPTIVQTTPGYPLDFAVAVDAAANAFALWTQDSPTGNRVWVSRSVPGATWSPATSIHPDSGTTARQAQVAIDPAGRAVAVWLEGNFYSQPYPLVSVWARLFR